MHWVGRLSLSQRNSINHILASLNPILLTLPCVTSQQAENFKKSMGPFTAMGSACRDEYNWINCMSNNFENLFPQRSQLYWYTVLKNMIEFIAATYKVGYRMYIDFWQ